MKVRELLPARRIVNLFGAIAYSALLLVYTVVAAMTLQWLITDGHLSVTTEETVVVQDETTEEQSRTTMGLIGEIFAYIVTSVMTLTVLFVAITLPYWLGRVGSYVMKRVIRWCKWPVTPLSLLCGKAIACAGIVAPLLLFIAQDIASLFSLLVIIVLAGLSFLLFLIQHYLAKMTSLPAAEIW